ncbi:phosphate ABC transporter permease subunit PstC [Glycomyces tenuis]|uniref:phosphate ABC transporter permease subunit PstC n=1 Tax=Glycomyces tenuis TaxID=58116 RepID=UPI00041980BC|nr:phosphate ABC transporter permease subunit PstC [Glycomyces tenuis]
MTNAKPVGTATVDVDTPRAIDPGLPVADRVFRGGARAVGLLVLAIMASIGVFMFSESGIAFDEFGWSFFTEHRWALETNQLGVLSLLVGTVTVAAVAIAIAVPFALTTALFITEYAPLRARRTLIALVDLMAAVPSVVYGLVGLILFQPYLADIARWIHDFFGWIAILDVPGADPDTTNWNNTAHQYTSSAFIAGVAVALMVMPVCAAVMREVFSQAPAGEREAALALGGTRWGVIRSVVLPFGRSGIVGGTMLGLGRALGETIAIALIIVPAFDVKLRILENGTITIASQIILRFGESSPLQLSALMFAGLVLFVFTLIVNTIAAAVVSRSRSGAATEI